MKRRRNQEDQVSLAKLATLLFAVFLVVCSVHPFHGSITLEGGEEKKGGVEPNFGEGEGIGLMPMEGETLVGTTTTTKAEEIEDWMRYSIF